MINFAPEIKSRISMIDVAHEYGFEINRSGFCRCPFHNDRKPSMKLYNGEHGYFCYVCKQGGDVIDFTQKYFNLTFPAAIEKLNSDFALGLPIDSDPNNEHRRFSSGVTAWKRKQEVEAYQKRLQLAQSEYDIALNIYCYLDSKRLANIPALHGNTFTDDYADALKRLPLAQYKLDTAEMELVRIEQEKGR